MKVKSPNVKSKNVKSRRFPKGKQPKTKKVSKPVIAKPDKRNSTAWEKVKLTGNLISDDGGTGLEGLLGLEVLESYGGVAITKAKHDRVKRGTKKYIEETVEKEEDAGDDGEQKKKKKKKKKKKADVVEQKVTTKPGQFVTLKAKVADGDGDKKKRPGKKQPKQRRTEVIDESKRLAIDDLIGWNGLGVPDQVLRAIAEKGFRSPTEIQTMTLPSAIMGRKDILGAAETGSGKTLAFGIPILNGIMQLKSSTDNRPFRKVEKSKKVVEVKIPERKKEEPQRKRQRHEERDNWTPPPEEINNFPDFGRDIVEDDDDEDVEASSKGGHKKPLYALVLTPTRELAVQVKDHLISAAKYTGIKVTAIFGGLAAVKQERVLAKCPEIVVATPGRLWELYTEGNPHLRKLEDIHFLAIDETDRMVEKGHFEELKLVLEKLNADPVKKAQRQNFVFSATLTMVHELPKYLQQKNRGRKNKLQTQSSDEKMQILIDHLGISQPKIVDITPRATTGGTAQRLTECRISCPLEQKDLYLYYFLQRHPGRTIVFCNSIECVRRLAKLFALLDCDPWALHAKMAQRQRLKNLERFTDSSTGLLIATDVAARGLDIPQVEHVIHYQVPRTSENYIHRSGRTARANAEGIAMLIMEPGETNDYVKLCRNLKRNEDLPLFPVSDRYLAAVRERVALARDVDILELKVRRKQSDIGWLKKSAKEMDILVDDMSDFSEGDMYDSDDGRGAVERTKERRQLQQKRDQLQRLLGQPIFPKGFSYKYPTTAAPFIGQTTANEVNPTGGQSTGANQQTDDKNAVSVMKDAIESYKLAKKMRNKKMKHLI